MSHPERPAAAILAGGRARRLGGADKAALSVGGATILARQLAALAVVAEPVFLVGHGTANPPEAAGLRRVADLIPGAGALGGIYSAIVQSPAERTLVVGCDMPFLPPRLLQRLVAEPGDIVMPRSRRGYEPLCAVYSKRCAAALRERIAHGELKASVPPPGVHVVELGPETLEQLDPDGLLLVNVNTPEDYAHANRLANRITP